MRVNTCIHVARFDVEVDLYGSHAIAIILRAITMPFEVFIFVWETSSILYFNIPAARLRALQKSSRKLALPNRESAIDFARYLHDLCGAGITYLARNQRVTPLQSLHLPRALSERFIKYLTFRYLRRNFSPAGYGKKN